MLNPSILFAAALTATLVGAPLQSAVAQNTPSVTATVSGYYAIGDGFIPEQQWQHIAVARNDAPLHAEASGHGGQFFTTCTDPCRFSPAFTSASVRGFASTDPGVLRIYGSALSIARWGENGPNLPRYENTNSVYSNSLAGASFIVYLTVTSPTLAVGAAVQVPFNYLAEVVSEPGLTYRYPLVAGASFNITGLGPQNFATNSFLPFFRPTPLVNGNVLYTVRSDADFSVAAHVGDVLTVSASFSISGQGNINPFNRSEVIGGFAGGRNTAGIWLGSLPGDIVITSASGHDYRLDPRSVAPVSEPASAALLLAGGLFVSAARRYVKRR